MTPAERLARHRAEMELALAEHLTLSEARLRLSEARLRRTARCGTAAVDRREPPPSPTPRPASWMDRYDNY